MIPDAVAVRLSPEERCLRPSSVRRRPNNGRCFAPGSCCWRRRNARRVRLLANSARPAGLAAAGLPVAVVNPAQVRSFADASGKRAKTDPIDAAVIARFAAACGVKAKMLADEQTRLLADLV